MESSVVLLLGSSSIHEVIGTTQALRTWDPVPSRIRAASLGALRHFAWLDHNLFTSS